ncbi:MAG: hypothetical protein ACR2LS_11355 [Thermomicrobiales bacterium]
MSRPLVSVSETEILPEIGSNADQEAGSRERRRDRLERERTAPLAAARTRPEGPSLFALLHSREGLRQALILQEILGPPKGRQ